MNPAMIIAMMALVQTILKTISDLTGKDVLLPADFATKTPEELLAENGIDVDDL